MCLTAAEVAEAEAAADPQPHLLQFRLRPLDQFVEKLVALGLIAAIIQMGVPFAARSHINVVRLLAHLHPLPRQQL